jgi:uncharacterized membrane protein
MAMPTLLIVTTAGVGLVAGVWFAFSAFVMQGLDRATPGAPAWHDYLNPWLAWNHVRTGTAIAALILLLLALIQE